jgi:hypothetical protein
MSQELRNNYLFQLMVDDDKRTRALSDLLVDFAAVAKATRELGAKGTVTLKISVDKDKNDEEALAISYDVTSSIPKAKRKSSIGFFDERTKTVIKTDPRQLELLAEKEDERLAKLERDRQLSEQGITKIGRGETATA